MNIDLVNLDQVHPVILREIGGALTRIAAALDATGVADNEDAQDEPKGFLENFFNNETVEISIPRGDEAVPEANARAQSIDAGPVGEHTIGDVAAPYVETPEQIDELLGDDSVVGAIAKDMLADSEARSVLTGGAVMLAAPGEGSLVESILKDTPPSVTYEKPPGTFEDFQKDQAGIPPNELDTDTGTVITGAPLATAGHIELDTAGLPWDERIHAGTKTHVKDGSWKFRPRITQELKDEVTAELRLTYPPIAAPVVQTDPTTGHVVPSAEEVFGDAAQAPQTAAAPAAQTAAAPLEYTFVSLLEEICTCVSNGQVTQGACDLVVADRCKKFGLTGLPDLQAQPDLVMQFRDSLNDILGARF